MVALTPLVGLVHAEDAFDDGVTQTSDLAEVGVSQRVGDMTLRATGNFAINDADENIDFPTTIVFGADYRLMPGVDLFAEYEDASGSEIEAQMTRMGVRATPWNRAQVDTSPLPTKLQNLAPGSLPISA